MKKLLFILILFITSCTYTKVDENTSVPNSITNELKTETIDTLYVIKSEDFHYYYNSDKILVEKYVTYKNEVSIPGLIFILWVLLTVVLIVILFNLFDS